MLSTVYHVIVAHNNTGPMIMIPYMLYGLLNFVCAIQYRVHHMFVAQHSTGTVTRIPYMLYRCQTFLILDKAYHVPVALHDIGTMTRILYVRVHTVYHVL